jgi:hypothetical protein
MRLNHDEYEQLVDEISRDICPGQGCLFKLIVTRLHPDPRLMLQLKCIDKFKSSKSLKSWENAIASWISDGCAESFAIAYKEAETRFLDTKHAPEFEVVYNRTLELVNTPKKKLKGLDFKI